MTRMLKISGADLVSWLSELIVDHGDLIKVARILNQSDIIAIKSHDESSRMDGFLMLPSIDDPEIRHVEELITRSIDDGKSISELLEEINIFENLKNARSSIDSE